MEDGVEFTGRTVDDAIEAAVAALGVDRDGLTIEVLSQGSRGILGIRTEPARIRAQTQAETPAPQFAGTQAAPSSAPDTGTDEDEFEDEDEAAPRDETGSSLNGDVNLPGEATDVLRLLLQSMGFEADVSIRSTENPIMLAITGENLGVLIGRRGDNLAALQFMVNLILSKNRRQWPRVVIDVENYRARREESLRTLADRIAFRVRRNRRPFTLEAMPASDRRIIHLTLRDRPDIETYSIGEGPARRVVIAPIRDGKDSSSDREAVQDSDRW